MWRDVEPFVSVAGNVGWLRNTSVMKMPSVIVRWILSLVISLLALTAVGEEASREELRSLDEQVQEVKSDVLGIAADLEVLEERLLFPSNTQVTVFVALGEDEEFRLDAVQLSIDGELAAHHIYSFKELEALQRGGVQRIFMGNLSTGAHRLEVSVLGKLSNGKEFSGVEHFSFDKGVEPRLLGITLAPLSGKPPIELKDW